MSLIIAQAEENIAREKELKLINAAERFLLDIEDAEASIARIQERIESNKDYLDKIARGDDAFVAKILANSAYGTMAATATASASNMMGTLR